MRKFPSDDDDEGIDETIECGICNGKGTRPSHSGPIKCRSCNGTGITVIKGPAQ